VGEVMTSLPIKKSSDLLKMSFRKATNLLPLWLLVWITSVPPLYSGKAMAVAGGWCSGNRNLKIGSSNTNLNSETIKKYFINLHSQLICF